MATEATTMATADRPCQRGRTKRSVARAKPPNNTTGRSSGFHPGVRESSMYDQIAVTASVAESTPRAAVS
jgi:hypothetical protein